MHLVEHQEFLNVLNWNVSASNTQNLCSLCLQTHKQHSIPFNHLIRKDVTVEKYELHYQL